ncbi:DNA glycosylase [Trametopsis cervina]|nr:DNA glycosylase [Trametopsis cervina]
MRTTRASTRAAKANGNAQESEEPAVKNEVKDTNGARSRKRKTDSEADDAEASATTVKKARATKSKKKSEDATKTEEPTQAKPAQAPAVVRTNGTPEALVPAVLTFSFEDAKRHIINADGRFEDIFNRMPCKPFEHLEQVDPFRTLTHSILGQQISWLAARSISHKFVRLFDPSLPEKPTDHNKTTDFFPSASQVTTMDIPTLRTAGLSQRKAEYVLDLAARFADGRLSTEKLLAAEDEELYELLTAVRGIGRWTVDMFAMFSLRRPDILPVGDLGVQRGLLRWILSLHSPDHNVALSPLKLPQSTAEKPKKRKKSEDDDDVLPVLGQTSKVAEENEEPDNVGVSSIPPVPVITVTPVANSKGRKGKSKAKLDSDDESEDESDVLPVPFTPSVNKILNKTSLTSNIPPLPAGLTVAELKRRVNAKNKIKGAFLTPKEMEDLTEPWKPYRSVAVYYMWALAEEPK